MLTAGIDCGAKNTKAVVLRNIKILGRASVRTGFDQAKAVEAALAEAVEAAGVSRQDLQLVAGTGSGKNAVMMADILVNDIKAMAAAARFFFPGSRTVVDVGAEEGRAAKIDQKGRTVDFAVNDKCAAGAGAFIEAMARALEVQIEQMGLLCLQSDKVIPLNAQCVIFAESEVIGLIHAGTEKPDISRAIHDAVAGRIASMVRRIGVEREVVLLGGLGRNRGFVASMLRELQLENLCVPDHPEYGAAAGAAVTAAEKA